MTWACMSACVFVCFGSCLTRRLLNAAVANNLCQPTREREVRVIWSERESDWQKIGGHCAHPDRAAAVATSQVVLMQCGDRSVVSTAETLYETTF